MKSTMRSIFNLILVLGFCLAVPYAARGEALPDSAYVSGLVGHAQGYSLSCESRSAADLAQFWGLEVGETEFLRSLPEAGNPEQGFVGDPNDAWGFLPPRGYGVHAGPVAASLRDFGLQAEAHDGLDWDDLRSEIAAGRPVIVWIIGAMWDGQAVEYEAPDGSTSRVAVFEHTMLLAGYNQDYVQVVDAYTGQYQTYSLGSFLKSWAVLGDMAVFAHRDQPAPTDPPPTSPTVTYTVQRGEYLIELAKRFGTSWRELAQLNSISYPYTLYPGQVLQLPPTQPPASTPEQPATPSAYQTTLPLVQRSTLLPLQAPARPTAAGPATMTVLYADSLIRYSHYMGLDWQLLIRLNDLQPPFLLYPGQVLKVR